MFVISPILGLEHSASLCISPKSLIPNSRTATSYVESNWNTIRGKPTSLLKFPLVLNTLYLLLKKAATKSFVDVFPVDPVTPITFIPSLFL